MSSVLDLTELPDRDFVRAALEAGGWYEGRRTDTSAWTDYLAEWGLKVFPAALDALAEFGGLSIRLPKPPKPRFGLERVTFDPVDASGGEIDRVEWWAFKLGKPMYPLGEVDYMLLLIAEDGSVYANTDIPHRPVLGTNIHEAVRQMILRDRRLETVLIY